ncbi:MAG: DUF3109 family protein [Ignavibacteriaceae bacterium]|nr:DUF3109 family protein [Ignavibacteriaceae bacterium]
MLPNNFIPIENVLVRPEIMDTNFSCDLEKCKGACCTIESEFGAPLLDEEIPIMEELLDIVFPYLPGENVALIKKHGFYNRKEGDAMTMSINKRECVFVYYDNAVAKCSIEKSFQDGKTSFRKPVSCHLFPIRVTKFGGDVLRYEKFNECTPALVKGKIENTKIVEFCKDSLIRSYGNKWYSSLMETKGK